MGTAKNTKYTYMAYFDEISGFDVSAPKILTLNSCQYIQIYK